MAMKKAIVASNVGWANEVIDDQENGFLIHPKNHNEYAQKILELLQNKDLRVHFGIEARKKVEEKFSMSIVAKKNTVFYEKVLSLFQKSSKS